MVFSHCLQVFNGLPRGRPQNPQYTPSKDAKYAYLMIMLVEGYGEYLKIQLRLYGVFRSAAGSRKVQLDVPSEKPTVRTAIDYLVSQTDFRKLKPLLIDESTMDPRPNALIMVSGREINTLNGLDTMLTEEDELSLLPVAHGG